MIELKTAIQALALAMLPSAFIAAASASEICYMEQGMTLDCSGSTGGNSADFSGACSMVPNMVPVECPTVYEEVNFTRHQAMEHCNRNAYDPDYYIYWGSGCNFDGATAYNACLEAGYEGAKNIRRGWWTKPYDNGITKWEPEQNRFVAYNAVDAGNSLIDGMTCWRYRQVTQ